jgi:hypothetical protein
MGSAPGFSVRKPRDDPRFQLEHNLVAWEGRWEKENATHPRIQIIGRNCNDYAWDAELSRSDSS